MATTNGAPNKINKEERAILTAALAMQETSLSRQAKAAKSPAIAEACQAEARKVANLANRINSGELEL